MFFSNKQRMTLQEASATTLIPESTKGITAPTLLKYTGANQVTMLLHPKVHSSSAGPHLPGPWVFAPHTCPLVGHRNIPLTSYLNQTLVSTRPSKRGITSKYQNLIHWYEVGRDSARHLLIRSNV